MRSSKYVFILPWLFSFYLCDVSVEKKTKLLTDFINYYNSQPNKDFTICDGNLRNIREIDVTSYRIDVSLNTSRDSSTPLKCSATIKDSGQVGISIVVDDFNCQEEETAVSNDPGSEESSDVHDLRTPVKLENEVQADTGVTSGEQFIAIPRHKTMVPCIGCSSNVNPQASGVNDLANMGVRHLDLHEPSVKHSLASVLEVERQVQIISGVKYILTLLINFNNCTNTNTEKESCDFTKTCKVSILVKPWQTLPSGVKYRAVLSNNCTEEWLFGDNGEILPDDNQHIGNESSIDGIKVDRYEDVQGSPNHEKKLTADEIKAIEDQIIGNEPHKFEKVETTVQHNTDTVTESADQETELTEDKKQAIDGILDLLNFPTVKSEKSRRSILRQKRSFDNRLQALSSTTFDLVSEKPQSVDNPKFKKMAEESLNKYLQTSSSQQHYRIIKIQQVTVEVNSGKSTNIDFVISPSDCIIEGNRSSSSNCNLINCHSTILEQDSLNNNQYTVNCKMNNQIPWRNRQLLSLKEESGSIESQDVNDPKYIKLAEESLRRYVQESNSAQSLVLTKIEKVLTTENREGLVTRIDFSVSSKKKSDLLKCTAKLWERTWMIKIPIKVFCQIDDRKQKRKVKGNTKDQNHTGYITEQNPNDRKYLELAEESLQEYLIQSGNRQSRKVVRVEKVSTEVVSVLPIIIDFVVKSGDKDNSYEFSCHSKIWEQPWVNKKKINVTCPADSQRWKRQLVGGIKEENPNEPKYFTLAEESLNKYLSETNNRRPHKVLRVEKVFSQVVAGSLTRIEFVVTSVDNISADVFRCHSKIWEQAWIYKKEIDVSCRTVYKRWKRKLSKKITEQNLNDPKYLFEDSKKFKNQLAGGIVEHDPTDLKYFSLAEESLEKYLSKSSDPLPLRVLQVEKVSSLKTVDTGTLTMIDFTITSSDTVRDAYIISCHSEIWEQTWIDKHEIKVSCPAGNKTLPGQVLYTDITEQNPNEPKYFALAEESLKKHFNDVGFRYHHHVVRVQTASTQEIAGLLTRINFVANSSDKADYNELSCHSEIWELTWINEKAILVSCSNIKSRSRKQIPSGITKQNPTEPKYLALADESLQKYLSDSGNPLQHRVVRVETVSTQVVAGSLTRIDFVAKPVDNVGADELRCHSKILEQAWANKKGITVSCSLSNKILKRQLAGGITQQDPNEPKYLALAEESLQKYLSQTGNQRPHRIVRVEKASTQVVAGSLTRIDFVVKSINTVDNNEFRCHSEIWEQPWRNKKEINVTCATNDKRLKRQIPGGITEQNPTEPKYLALAEESLQKYLSDNGNPLPHRVVRVETVSTQVVAGSLTRIDFVVKPIDNVGADEFSCHSKIWEQAWANKKEITVSCSLSNKRLKRQLVGGVTEQDPNEPKYLALAEASLQKYLSESSNPRPHSVVRVEKASTQVVAGSLTRIDFVVKSSDTVDNNEFRCHSEIWEQPWRNKKEINVTCATNDKRLKRQIPGGITEQNPTEPKYLALAEESLQKYLSDNGNPLPHRVVRVETVSTQVVAGSLTRIDFVVKPIDNVGADEFSCHSKIWEQAWANKKEITVSCSFSNKRLKRQLVGGVTEQDPNEPKYLALAEASLQKYLSESSNPRPHSVVRVEKASTQVVAGSLTRIDFVVKSSDTVDNNEFRCHSEIWEQPWRNKKEINVTCATNDKRLKRQIPGGITEQNPTEPKYLALAEESLQKYLSDNGNPLPHRVVRVETVSTQVVAGSLTRIDFVVKPIDNVGADEFSCHSKIWEQAWANKKEITVSCSLSNKRLKRQLVGGVTEQDPSEPKYLALAEESLQKYLSESGNPRPHSVIRVEKASTQIVAGSLTKIDFVVKSSDIVDNNEFSCHSEIWQQPWRNKKEINVTCATNDRRLKRQIPGGFTEQNPTEPKYLALAEESLQKYLSDRGNSRPHSVVRVKKVSTQVVAGVLTRIDFGAKPTDNVGADELSCHSKIWEQAWANKKEITVSCSLSNKRLKRQLAGDIMKQNPNEPKYLALAEESLKKYLNDSGIRHHHRVVRIEKVSTQEVAGSLTRIDFVVMSAGYFGADEFYCHSKIWEQPWLNRKDMNVTCQIGVLEKDLDASVYVQLAEESLQKYLKKMSIQRQYNVAKIVKVDTSNIDGQTIKIDFLITPVNNPNGDVHNCLSKIFMKTSLNNKEIDVFCAINLSKHKRSLEYEGIRKRDPSDPRYLRLAQKYLKQFLEESNNKTPYKVIRVDKVTTENLSGTWTRIYFLVAPADNVTNLYQCFSTVWEHYWITQTQSNVSCLFDDVVQNRVVPFGLTEENPKDGKYIKLAEISLDKYLSSVGDIGPHKLIRLHRVLVNNMYTILNFEAVRTSDSNIIMNCSADIIEYNVQNSKIVCAKTIVKKRELFFGNNMISEPPTKKRGEVEEDVTNPEYKLLAAQALRKYSKRTGMLYKLLNVTRVTKRVVAGLMYAMKFTAFSTECPADISQALARSCKKTSNVTVDCKANVWDQPWIRKVKINIQCNAPETDTNQTSISDKESEIKKETNYKKKLDFNIYALAEEALEQYLIRTKRKYFYKITKIVSSSTSVTDGISTNIMFLISPTVCQRHVYMESIDDCALKKPRVQYNCKTEIIEHPWIEAKKDIRIICQKLYNNELKYGKRQKRQMFEFVDEMDEDDTNKDIISYYLHRAVQEVNKQSGSNDTFELESVHATQINTKKNATVAKIAIQIANHQVHRLCNVKIYPSSGDKYMIKNVSVICDDIDMEDSAVGLNILKLIKLSIKEIEKDSKMNFKIVHQGEPKINYDIASNDPIKLYFSFATTNCTKTVDYAKNSSICTIDANIPLKYCVSFIWRHTKTKTISNINVTCDTSSQNHEKAFGIDYIENNFDHKVDKQFNNMKIINLLTQKALRLIEAKYPQSNKLKIERVITHKQVIEGTHYRMKVTVGGTNCTALSDQNLCHLVDDKSKLCSVDVWLDKKAARPPMFQVSCSLETGYVADNAQAKALFNKFMVTYKPKYIYDEEERKNRLEIFRQNIRKIHNFNVFERASATYGVTRFADLTYEEFSSRFTGLTDSARNDDDDHFMKEADIPHIKIPASFDWREFHAVTDVKDQGYCRGSWAFSVIGNIESQMHIKAKDQLSLSEQQLMDCDQLNHGCEGGLPENAYRSLMEADVSKCLFNNMEFNVKISGGVNISSNEWEMAKWLVKNGPISIGVNAAAMQFYLGGIIHPKNSLCSKTKQDHSVLIVGYGEEADEIYGTKIPYWIVKNSWGKNWGEEGYYRLYRGDNTCGVSKMATSILIES